MKKEKLFCLLLMIIMIMSMLPIHAAADDSIIINVTIRDFEEDGNLFEGEVGSYEGLVRPKIGANRKPDFSDPANPSQPLPDWQNWGITKLVTLADLNTLFNDDAGKNMTTTKKLTMVKDTNGFYSIKHTDDDMFFPIDNELFRNEGNEHNFHFTMELHAKFNYQGFEEFTFEGDDDVWVFINGQLIIDLGGVHSSEYASISLPELVSEEKLNIKPGQSFDFDLFYMERHTTESNLSIITNIDLSNMEYDKASSWAVPELDKAAEYGLITDRIKDNMAGKVTREEFAEIAVKLYEKYTGKTATAGNISFVDTNNPEILKAANLGLVKGVGNDKYAPNDLVTREQMATILLRALQVMNPMADFSTAGAAKFADDNKIESWARDGVYYCAKASIVGGIGSNMFDPDGNATREQAVIVCKRAYEFYKK